MDDYNNSDNATNIVEENRARRLRQAVLDAKIKERGGGSEAQAVAKKAKTVVKVARTARLIYAGCGCCSCSLPLLMWLVIFLIIAMAVVYTVDAFILFGGEAMRWFWDWFN